MIDSNEVKRVMCEILFILNVKLYSQVVYHSPKLKSFKEYSTSLYNRNNQLYFFTVLNLVCRNSVFYIRVDSDKLLGLLVHPLL